MILDFKRMPYKNQFSENILDEYQNVWDVSPSINNEKLRSCEQKLIKLDKIELEYYLQHFVRKTLCRTYRRNHFNNQIKKKYAPCVLLHLIHVFCIPGQEEKMKVVQFELNVVLYTMTEEERCDIFERYISQQLKVKSSLTEIDLLTSQIESHHEFLMKLCYWDTFCAKNDKEGYKVFLKKNSDFLVSKIEGMPTNCNRGFMRHIKLHLIACNILLCLLKWDLCETKIPVTLQYYWETQHPFSFASEGYTPTHYTIPYRAKYMLQKILTTLSEEEIFTAFNNYIGQMYSLESEITEVDFCTGKIYPFFEFQLKLCYCEKLFNEKDYKRYKDFFRRNADFLVKQIEKVVNGYETKTKYISCKILLGLLKWNICNQKTISIPLTFQDCEIKTCSSFTSAAEHTTKYTSKANTIKTILQKLLAVLSEEEIFTAFNNYLDQMYTMNSEITEDDFCTGKIEPYNEFLLKLCYCEKLCSKNDDTLKEFLSKNADLFVSQIEEVVRGNKTKIKFISCKILLCFLNLHICYLKTTFIPSKIQNSEIQQSCSFQPEAENTTNNACTMYRVRCILENLLSTQTDHDISEVFNDYIEQMFALKSEITPDGLCIGVAVSHHEFKLKLFYWETICRKKEFGAYKKFIQMYPEFLVSYIEKKIVLCQKTESKHLLCMTLLSILNLSICTLKTAPLLVQKEEMQASFQSEEDNTTKHAYTIYKVRCILQNLLSTLAEDEISEVFNDYIDQMYAMTSKITPDGLCIGVAVSHHEFKLKLCYWETICRKKDFGAYKKFIQLYPEFLVSYIEEVVQKNETGIGISSCKTLLCILNWNVFPQKTSTPLNFQDCTLTSGVKKATKYPYTADKVRSILQKILSTLSEDEIFSAFNDYLDQMKTMNSEITEDDLCNGKIEPYHGSMLKLCYCDKLWDTIDCFEPYREFLRKNADLLVVQIERVVHGNNTEIKLASCKILLCLLNWNICTLKTAILLIQNAEIQTSSSTAIVSDTPSKYSFTAETIRNVLQQLLSTFSEEEILTLFNNYIDLLYAMNSEITDDGLCTGKIEPYHEFMLKLCYCEKLWEAIDCFEPYQEFLRKNADLLVVQIERVVHGNNTEIKLASCKILLCLLNWNICDLESTFIRSEIHTNEIQQSCTKYNVRCILQNLLSTLAEDEISEVFNDYIDQMYAMTSKITPDGLCIGVAVSHHEFKLKLCYWETICRKKDFGAYKKFIQLYPEFLVSYIEEVVQKNETGIGISSCKTLLCILNWNVFPQKTSTPLNFQDCTLTSGVKKATKYPYTADKVRSILQKILSTLSEDEIFSAFNDYLDQMKTMNSEITEDDLCNGKIGPYHGSMLKLCYCDKLWDTIDCFEPYREFLRKNADLLVVQIERVVHGNNTEIKLASCKILLCLLNWNICDLESTFIRSEIHTNEIQQSCTKYNVRCILQNLLSTLAEDEISEVFNDYIDQMYAMTSKITPDGLCIGEKVSHHEFQLKLCYWLTICKKKDYEAIKKFIQLCPDVLVSHIEEHVQQFEPKTKLYICKTLLCILNWHICTLKKAQFLVQNTEIQASQSFAIVDDLTIKTIGRILKIVLSTLSEEEIFTAFNEYLDKILTRKSEITEDDFCTGKIEPYHEFMMKLCYCEKLCNEHDDDETYRKFLRKNADFLATKIEEVVGGNNTKTKFIACKVLLCLVKWDLCHQKTAYTPLNNILSQMLTKKEDCQAFMNENALFFVSMVRTVIKRHNIPLLINLCDVLICISHIELHFYEVTGAVNKLIRYYMNQVGTNERTLQSILLLGYRFLKHLNDNQKIDTARKKKLGFPKFCKLLEELSTDSRKERKALDLLIEAFKDNTNPCHGNQNKYCNYLRDFTKVQDAIKQEDSCKAMQFSYDSIIQKYSPFLPKNFGYRFVSSLNRFYSPVRSEDIFSKPLCQNLFVDIFAWIMMVCILVVWTSPGHRSSAKLEKYLALKHHYAMASLYLLWCSGDIEVHPGPRTGKKTLVHDSSIKRTWIQNVYKMLDTKLSNGVQSKYREKKGRISDKEHRELFKDLLKVCYEEKVLVPQQYLAEINAWETMEYKLLHKLFIYRCEIETIIASLQDFLTCGGSTNDLTDINVSIITELKTNEIAMFLGQDQRPKDISQMVAHITRHIAGISIKCAHGKDPDTKCDGLWDLPLKNWPKDIILFDPNNRGKYSEEKTGKKLIPDQELVDMLLRLPQVTIPQKYKDIIEAFKAMRKSKTKQHKEQLCSTFKRSTSLEKINYALKNLCKNGILTEEMHDILTKWWTTGVVEAGDNQTQSLENMDVSKKVERPHILINIHTNSITFTVKPTIPNCSQVSYEFPVKYELVPLKTMKLLPTSEENSGDNQTDSIIPQATMNISNSTTTFDPNSQAMFRSDIKLQCKTSTQDTASSSMTHQNQTTSSSFQFSKSTQNIAIYGQPGPILCTHNQLTTNSDDLGHLHLSAIIDSKNLAFQNLVSPTSDMGSSYSISSVNSESGNEERDQNNTLSEGQDLFTDSGYSSDSSNNCVLKTSLKKRKCIEKDRIEMKKRKIPSPKQDKKQSDPTNHRKDDSSMDNSTIFNTNMELLQDCLQIDLDSFVFDDQTFDMKLNALDYEDKNPQICDKDGNLMNGEMQMSNENTNISAYKTSVSTILEKFVQDMINKEHEKMSQMKTSLSEV